MQYKVHFTDPKKASLLPCPGCLAAGLKALPRPKRSKTFGPLSWSTWLSSTSSYAGKTCVSSR